MKQVGGACHWRRCAAKARGGCKVTRAPARGEPVRGRNTGARAVRTGGSYVNYGGDFVGVDSQRNLHTKSRRTICRSRYLNEFFYRHNNRYNPDAFADLITTCGN
jgi:hypothetical protein